MVDIISSINNVSSVGATQSSSELGQADFLRLMTAELKNQDPDSPMDSQNMLEQFSTLNNVTAINKLTTTLTGFINDQNSQSTFDAANMIGKEVSFVSNQFNSVQDSVVGFVEPPTGVSDVTLYLKNKAGDVLDTQALNTDDGQVGYGFEFSGLNSGDYTVEAVYEDGNQNISVDVLQSSDVENVRLEQGQTYFKLKSGGYALLSDLRTISA